MSTKLAWPASVDSQPHPHQVPGAALDKQLLVGTTPSCGRGPSEPCPSSTHENHMGFLSIPPPSEATVMGTPSGLDCPSAWCVGAGPSILK